MQKKNLSLLAPLFGQISIKNVKIPQGAIQGPSNNESLKVPIDEIAEHLALHAKAADLKGKEFQQIDAFQHPLEQFFDQL